MVVDLGKYKKTMQKFFERTHASYLDENQRKSSVDNENVDQNVKTRMSSNDKLVEFTSEHDMLTNPTLIKFFDYNHEYLRMFIKMEMRQVEVKKEERR